MSLGFQYIKAKFTEGRHIVIAAFRNAVSPRNVLSGALC